MSDPTLPPPPAQWPPPGWYPDPSGQPGLRWWDGHSWTENTSTLPPLQSADGRTRLTVGGRVVTLSGWWRRVGGSILDGLIVGIPLGILEFIAVGETTNLAGFGTGHATVSIHVPAVFFSGLLGLAAVTAYTVLLLHARGQTVGMMAMKIQAVDLDSGGALTWPQIWRRVFALFVLTQLWSELGLIVLWAQGGGDAVTFGGYAIFNILVAAGSLTTYLWPLGSPLNQTLQDKYARTIVVIK